MASASSDRHATGFVMAEDDRTAVTVIGPGENATYYGDDAGVASVYFMALIGLSHEVWISYLHTLALVGVENVGAMNFAPAAKSLLTPTLDLLTEFARADDEDDYPPSPVPSASTRH